MWPGLCTHNTHAQQRGGRRDLKTVWLRGGNQCWVLSAARARATTALLVATATHIVHAALAADGAPRRRCGSVPCSTRGVWGRAGRHRARRYGALRAAPTLAQWQHIGSIGAFARASRRSAFGLVSSTVCVVAALAVVCWVAGSGVVAFANGGLIGLGVGTPCASCAHHVVAWPRAVWTRVLLCHRPSSSARPPSLLPDRPEDAHKPKAFYFFSRRRRVYHSVVDFISF